MKGNNGKCAGETFKNKLKPEAKPFHVKAYRIPCDYIYKVRTIYLYGKTQVYSIFTKLTYNGPLNASLLAIGFITQFKEQDKTIQSNTFPIPNIEYYLDAIGRLKFDIVIGLNMGYYVS